MSHSTVNINSYSKSSITFLLLLPAFTLQIPFLENYRFQPTKSTTINYLAKPENPHFLFNNLYEHAPLSLVFVCIGTV